MKTKSVPFTEVLHKHHIYSKSDMGPWWKTMTEWRREQIGPAQLCDMKEYLWKSFEQFCETRWHSSEWVLEGPNDEFRGVKKSEVATNSTIIQKENEDSGKRSKVDAVEDIGEFDSLTGVEPDDLNLLTKFGGVDNYKVRRYRVQVFDNTPKKVIFEAFAEADPSSRGITLDKLAIRALKARTKAVEDESRKFRDLAEGLDAGPQLINAQNYIARQL